MNKSAIYVYSEIRAGQHVTLKKVSKRKDLQLKAGERYSSAYITSGEFLKERDDSIFDDEFCVHAIEMRGGSFTSQKVEKLSLRVISKNPDKNMKGFMNKLRTHLKNSDNYGVGIGDGLLYSRTFYNRLEIIGKTLWFDFDRKSKPIQIA